MANLNSESCHSLIGFLTPEYLGFLKLLVIPQFTGTGTCMYITRTRKPESGYLNLSNVHLILRDVTDCKISPYNNFFSFDNNFFSVYRMTSVIVFLLFAMSGILNTVAQEGKMVNFTIVTTV